MYRYEVLKGLLYVFIIMGWLMLHQDLTEFVQEILPEARIEPLLLPNATGIKLYLLNADYPQDGLSQEAVIRLMDEPFYWSFCWASGLVLSQYLLENIELVRGKRVVDFGCGSGVVAIAAAMAGAKEVIACDIDPVAMLATRSNAELNQQILSYIDDFDAIEGDIDIIIVADVLYEQSNLPWLARFKDRAGQVLLADSRVKDFNYPPYKMIDRREARTIPDLDESMEFRDVKIYQA